MAVEQYDAIVIGAGQSGGPLTSALAANGLKTALIERSKIGGTCVNWGCTPTKTMVASARIAHLVRRARDFGVNAGATSVDMRVVRQRTRDLVDMFHSGSRDTVLSTEGLDLLMGEARFTGEKTIAVTLDDGGVRELAAGKVFINTGTETVIPKIAGIDEIPYLTSTTVMELDEVPAHLIVLGGGYIGLEFAQMFRRFGSDVTILQRGSQLLKQEDQDVAGKLLEIFEEDGINVLLNSSLEQIQQGEGENSIIASVRGDDGEVDITGSHFLIATGRRPSTHVLSPEKSGIALDDSGFVKVNERLETNVPGVWSMGDVTGGPAFTHISYNDYQVLEKNLFGNGQASTRNRVVPYVVFIDPELARVGMTEREARECHENVRIASMPMSSVARALETDETRGLMKAVIDGDSERILGAVVFGVSGGEIMSIIHLAMVTGTPFSTLRDIPFAHPTVSEALNNLFSQVE